MDIFIGTDPADGQTGSNPTSLLTVAKPKRKLLSFPDCWVGGCRPRNRTCDNSRTSCPNYPRQNPHRSLEDTTRMVTGST